MGTVKKIYSKGKLESLLKIGEKKKGLKSVVFDKKYVTTQKHEFWQ